METIFNGENVLLEGLVLTWKESSWGLLRGRVHMEERSS